MKKGQLVHFVPILTALTLVLFSACSSSDSEDIAENVLPSTMARIIHLSPDTPEVDIDFELIEVQETIVGLSYLDASPYTEVSSGITDVIVKRASDGQEIANYDDPAFSIEDDNTVYAVNFLAALEFIKSEDDLDTDPTRAKIRFVNAAPDSPSVDLKTDDPAGDALFANVAFKGIADYVFPVGGTFTFVITETGNTSDAVATFGPVALEAGRIYTIAARGTVAAGDDYDFGLTIFTDTDSSQPPINLEAL